MHIILTTLTTWNTCIIQTNLITLITPTNLITRQQLVQPSTAKYSQVQPCTAQFFLLLTSAAQQSPVQSSCPTFCVQKPLSLLCLIFNCEWLAVLKWDGVMIKLLTWLHELLSYIFRSARTSCRDFDFSTRPPAAAYIDNFFWTYGLTDYQIEGIPCGPL